MRKLSFIAIILIIFSSLFIGCGDDDDDDDNDTMGGESGYGTYPPPAGAWAEYVDVSSNGRFKIESYDERSFAQRNDCCRSSIEAGKKRNKASQIGICNKAGKQPPIGFTPAFLYKAIVAC